MTPHALLALLPLLALRAAAMPMPLRRMSTGSNPLTAALGLDDLSSTTSDLLGSTVGALGGVQDLLSTSSSPDGDGGSDGGQGQGLDLLSGNSLLSTLTDLGHDLGSALGLNTTLHAVLDGTPLAFIASDVELLSADNLLCTKVSTNVLDKVLDFGCVCLGKQGLWVDDAAALNDVAGLSAWVEAQVQALGKPKSYAAGSVPTCGDGSGSGGDGDGDGNGQYGDGDGGFNCPGGQQRKADGTCPILIGFPSQSPSPSSTPTPSASASVVVNSVPSAAPTSTGLTSSPAAPSASATAVSTTEDDDPECDEDQEGDDGQGVATPTSVVLINSVPSTSSAAPAPAGPTGALTAQGFQPTGNGGGGGNGYDNGNGNNNNNGGGSSPTVYNAAEATATTTSTVTIPATAFIQVVTVTETQTVTQTQTQTQTQTETATVTSTQTAWATTTVTAQSTDNGGACDQSIGVASVPVQQASHSPYTPAAAPSSSLSAVQPSSYAAYTVAAASTASPTYGAPSTSPVVLVQSVGPTSSSPTPASTSSSAPAPSASAASDDDGDDDGVFGASPPVLLSQCPSGQQWMTTRCCRTDQVEVDGECQCPSGQTLDSILSLCVKTCLDALGMQNVCVDLDANVGNGGLSINGQELGSGLLGLTGSQSVGLNVSDLTQSLGVNDLVKSLGVDHLTSALGVGGLTKDLGLDGVTKSLGLDGLTSSLGLRSESEQGLEARSDLLGLDDTTGDLLSLDGLTDGLLGNGDGDLLNVGSTTNVLLGSPTGNDDLLGLGGLLDNGSILGQLLRVKRSLLGLGDDDLLDLGGLTDGLLKDDDLLGVDGLTDGLLGETDVLATAGAKDGLLGLNKRDLSLGQLTDTLRLGKVLGGLGGQSQTYKGTEGGLLGLGKSVWLKTHEDV